ncbi:MAG TPA: 2-oxoglutarate dehydrogenase, E2 component, dihydrolipoamide succinyltransferase, partial [Trebonia sp.]|nr:2-oxoglutarate dehydrogenase, E2 component, dihydrolipoamide succinyltransferase [Trebonia sp.]
MSVSVVMPQLGESVTEGTVTRWLKKEGEHVTADEPLLEVSTDKVDTEIPSPASGILRGIAVDEDETVAVGAQLAVIEDSDSAGAPSSAPAPAAPEAQAPEAQAPAAQAPAAQAQTPEAQAPEAQAPAAQAPAAQAQAPEAQAPAAPAAPAYAPPSPAPERQAPAPAAAAAAPGNGGSAPSTTWSWNSPAAPAAPAYAPPDSPAPAAYISPAPASAPEAPAAEEEPADDAYPEPTPLPSGDSPYVTPLVRKLAAEHSVPLEAIAGTGVGGRIRKQDVLDAARAQRAADAAAAAAATPAPAPAAAPAAAPAPATAPARPAVVPSALRGTTQRMSRPRQVIAKRMLESLQTSAQLTTVVEADVTGIARLRDRAKAAFEAREGVKLTFLPFFAQATVEALKVHPVLNAVINGETQEVTYHAAEHLGVAVDTERGLMVPVVHNAGDLNIGGLARKIADVAARTRDGQVGPDELAGGTFTLTNTGSRGALFDTPIINQPQVAILGVGSVVKRAVVVEDPALGEVIAVRSMVYLALTYDHRLVDGADAARFLVTV